MDEKNIIISIKNMSFAYETDDAEKVYALRDIDLDIARGSFVAVVGRNGSGKSTLAKNMNALLLPTGGAIYVNGISTAEDDHLWELRETVGMVFQNPDNQLVSSVVEDDVAFGPENIGIDPKEIRERVDEALKAVNMYEYRTKGPHLLSGGQKQRVAIAGVLAMKPECIVFDEPTAMLDPSGRKDIMRTILKLHDEGKTIVLITHFMEEAALADRIVVIHEGEVAMDGAPEDIFMRAKELAAIDLEPPFAAKLAEDLRDRGVPVPAGVITEEGLADYLCGSK